MLKKHYGQRKADCYAPRTMATAEFHDMLQIAKLGPVQLFVVLALLFKFGDAQATACPPPRFVVN